MFTIASTSTDGAFSEADIVYRHIRSTNLIDVYIRLTNRGNGVVRVIWTVNIFAAASGFGTET
jgi:hypothetical protein